MEMLLIDAIGSTLAAAIHESPDCETNVVVAKR